MNSNYLKKIKHFLKQNNTILFFIVFLAYILRILPYLFGYSIPFTEDSIRDFQQIKYIIDNNGQLNLFNSYKDYGAFPILHLIIVFIASLGLPALKVFLFFPQILPSLGIVFYYLFLKKYFPTKHSLWACFLIAVFIPHIQWSAQPVRETIGLFLFPIIIYLFDKVITEKNNIIKNSILLILALLLIIPTHHWSAIMTLVWLTGFSIFFANSFKQYLYSLGLIVLFTISNLIYWKYLFTISFILIKNLALHFNFSQLIILLLLMAIIFIFKKINFDKFKTKDNRRNSLLIIIILLWLIANNLLPIHYPLQIWFHFFIFLSCIFIGFFYTKNTVLNKLTAITVFYSFFILIILAFNNFQNINLDSMPFDPFRTFEFAIFPLSIITAYGLIKISEKHQHLKTGFIIILIITATFAYPPIFIYGKTFIGTPFYDIRSEIRHISDGEIDLIKWANDHGYNVSSNRPEIRSYQAVFFPIQNKIKKIVTNSDEILKENYKYIHDPIMMVEAYKKNSASDNEKIFYENQSGFLVELYDDAKFLTHNIPNTITAGDTITLEVKMVNTSGYVWYQSDNYRMKSEEYNNLNLKLNKPEVGLNDVAVFTKDIVIPNNPEKYKFKLRIYKDGLGFFGDFTPEINVTVKP